MVKTNSISPNSFTKCERVMIHRIAEMPDDNPGEKHARRAEADAAEFQTAQRHPEHTHKGERADRVRDRLRLVKLEKPVHRLLKTIIPLVLPAGRREQRCGALDDAEKFISGPAIEWPRAKCWRCGEVLPAPFHQATKESWPARRLRRPGAAARA